MSQGVHRIWGADRDSISGIFKWMSQSSRCVDVLFLQLEHTVATWGVVSQIKPAVRSCRQYLRDAM